MKKIISLALALLMLAALLAPATAEGRTGGTLIALLPSDPTSYNPDAAMDDYSITVMENIVNKLVKFDYAGNLIPDLAESWTVSEDGLTLTYNLRKGVKWHDGEAFSSEDVLWSLNKIKAEGYIGYTLMGVTDIAAPDENTVVLTLAQPDASLIYNMAYFGMYILPKHLYDGQDWATCDAATKLPIGTGAYKFVEHNKGVSLTLEANMDYFLGAPQTDKIIYSIIPDATTATQAFLNGELDFLGTFASTTELENLKAAGATVITRPFASRYYIAFNFDREPTNNLELRKAIALALNRQEVLDKGLGGIGAVAEGFAPAAIAWAYNDQDVMPAFDPAKAAQVLEASGLKKGDDGFYCTLNLVTMTGWDDPATVIKANLREIGINVNISIMDMGAYSNAVLVDHDFDITLLSGNHGPDASAMSMRVGTGGAVNVMNYSNPAIDELYAKALLVSAQEERAAYYKEAQKILSQDLPILPLCEAVITEVSASYLSDTPLSAEKLSTLGEMFTIKMNNQ